MKDRVVKSVFWMVWSKGGVQAITLLSTIFIARLLTPADYGVIALAAIWIFPITLIAEMGLGAAIVQFSDITKEELNACFWLTNGVAALGYVALYASAPGIAQWFDSPVLATVIRINGVVLLLVAIRVVPDSLLRKRLALDKISQAELGSAVLTMPVMLVLAVSGAGVWTLVGGMLVGSFTQTALTFWFLPWKPGWTIGSERLTKVFRYSLSTLGSKLCWAVYHQADGFVLGKVSGDVVLGAYSIAKQIATLPVEKISSLVNQLASPILAELQDKHDLMQSSLLRGVRLVACIAFPMCVGMSFVAHELVHVLLTEKWSQAVPALQILCIYTAVQSIAVLLPPVLMATFRSQFLFGYTFVLLIIMPIVFFIGAEWGGGIGVALAWAAVYPILMFRMAYEALSEIGISLRIFVQQLLSLIAATACMACALVVIRWGLSAWPNELALIKLLVMVITGVLVYAASLFFIDLPMWRELQQVCSWAFGGGRGIKRTLELPA